VPRNEVNHPTFLRSATHVSRKDLKYGEAFREASRRAQEAGAPLFIPTFTSLRRNIVEHLTRSLHRLEEKMSRIQQGQKRMCCKQLSYWNTWVSIFEQNGASSYLTPDQPHVDQVIKSEIRQARLEDPIYSRSQGLSVLHFDKLDHTQNKKPWLMVNKDWGEQSHTVVESIYADKINKMLPDRCQDRLKACVSPFTLLKTTT
jgi:hypothetical protein